MPSTMRAAFIRRYGDNQVVELGERQVPRVDPREVSIRVHAAAINPRDWMLRDGTYVGRHLVLGFPKVLGSDIAGVVVKVGRLVRKLRVGDEVFAMQTTFGQMGGYAEYISILANVVARKPRTASFVETAGLPVAGLTALQGLRDEGRLGRGERVAVIGASGGVGHYAVQIAKAAGAEVVGVCSEANAALVIELGADATLDYRAVDVVDALDERGGVDVLFDAVGKGSLAHYRKCIRAGGRYVSTVPNPSNAKAQLLTSPARRLSAGAARLGVPLPPVSRTILVRPRRRDLDTLARMVDDGQLRTHIDSVHDFERVHDALTRSRSQRARGKIVLAVR